MCTNNRARIGTSRVAELPEIKQRQLANLLATRRRLAALAAKHHSHGLDDAVDPRQVRPHPRRHLPEPVALHR